MFHSSSFHCIIRLTDTYRLCSWQCQTGLDRKCESPLCFSSKRVVSHSWPGHWSISLHPYWNSVTLQTTKTGLDICPTLQGRSHNIQVGCMNMYNIPSLYLTLAAWSHFKLHAATFLQSFQVPFFTTRTESEMNQDEWRKESSFTYTQHTGCFVH